MEGLVHNASASCECDVISAASNIFVNAARASHLAMLGSAIGEAELEVAALNCLLNHNFFCCWCSLDVHTKQGVSIGRSPSDLDLRLGKPGWKGAREHDLGTNAGWPSLEWADAIPRDGAGAQWQGESLWL